MTPNVVLMVLVLAIWMLACAWCGLRSRYLRFALVAVAGLAVNHAWMVWGLQARPLGTNALVAQSAALLYALCAFATGWLLGRFVRKWKSAGAGRTAI